MLKQILIGAGGLVVLALGGYATFIYLQSHPTQAAIAQTQSLNVLDTKLGSNHLDARLYLTACASCHYVAVGGYSEDRPDLWNNDTLSNDDPTKLINIIFNGKGSQMPAFGLGLKDGEIAMIAAYLRASRTKNAPWTDLESKVAAVRAKANSKSGASKP
jgi:mono/diheme cytochrome c family protein